MVEKALKRYPAIDLSHNFLVGYSECDIELACRIGLKAFGIGGNLGRTDYISVASLLDISRDLSSSIVSDCQYLYRLGQRQGCQPFGTGQRI